jgi:tetratricopeptide (TPR) repeat protein
MNYGILLEKSGKRDSSVYYLQAALDKTPELVSVRYSLAGMLLNDPLRRSEAIHLYRSVIADRPGKLAAYYGIGLGYERDGQLDSALTNYLRAAARYDPSLAEYLYPALSRTYLQTNPTAGRSFFNELIEVRPHSPYGYAFSGVLDTSDRAWLNRLAQVDLSVEEHYELIARVVGQLFFAEANGLAIEVARRGAQIHPDLMDAHSTLTVILLLDGQVDEAEKPFRRMLTTARENEQIEDFCDEVTGFDYYTPLLDRPPISRLMQKHCPTHADDR